MAIDTATDRDSEGRQTCWRLMRDIGTCMLVTSINGVPRARPMSAIIAEVGEPIWFLTDADSHKMDELARAPDVCVTFSDGASRHVSLLGHATLINDRDAVRELWTPAANAFWPDGPDDRSVNAIRVEPVSAEYWHGDGTIVAAAKAMFAAATGRRADLGSNEKLVL
jgi:general stress protein 26